jgi:hypothetical protein
MKRRFLFFEVSNLKTEMMKCRIFDNDLMLYAEGSLDGKKKAAVETHLSECHDCRSALAVISDTRILIEKEKSMVPNQFLFTRIIAGLDSGKMNHYEYKRILVPAMVASFLILVAVLGGMNLGRLLYMNHEDVSYIIQQENRSLNDLKQESIENFFLTSENFKKDE